MGRRAAGTLILVVGAALGAPWLDQADAVGIKGKLEVRILELGYVPAAKTLKLRALPTAGPAVELQTGDAETIDRLIRLAEIKSQGGRLAVEIDGEEIKAIDVAVGGGFFIAKAE